MRADGKDSVTHYDTIEAFRRATLLDIKLETGRTHQIRVHMSALHHPCVGDLTYGADPKLAQFRDDLRFDPLLPLPLGGQRSEPFLRKAADHVDDQRVAIG